MTVTVLRVFNPVGRCSPSRTLPGRAARELARAIREDRDTIRLGALDTYRDYIDTRDVARAAIAASMRGASDATILNVGRGEATCSRDLVYSLAAIAGYQGTIVESGDGSSRSARLSWQCADISVIRSPPGLAAPPLRPRTPSRNCGISCRRRSYPSPKEQSHDRAARIEGVVMCGVIGVVSRRATRRPPCSADVLAAFDSAMAFLDQPGLDDSDRLWSAARGLGVVNAMLRGVPGVTALIRQPDLVPAIRTRLADVELAIAAVDAAPRRPGRRPVLPVRRRPPGRRWGAAGRCRGRSSTTACERPRRWPIWRGRRPVTPPWTRSPPFRSRCRAWIGSRCGGGTPPVCTSSCATTVSTSMTRPSRRHSRHAPILDSRAAPYGEPVRSWRSRTRWQPRSGNSATTRARCGPRSVATHCCTKRSPRPARESRCSASTRWASVGVVSEANAHPVNSDELDVRLAAPTSPPRSTATSTTSSSYGRGTVSPSIRTSRPTPRSFPPWWRAPPVTSG